MMDLSILLGPGVTVTLVLGGLVTGMYWAARAYDRRLARVKASLTPAMPTFRRPVEFGPLHVPWSQIECMRACILIDQLTGGPHDTDHVAFWLEHWHDAPLSLTGHTL